MINLIRPVLVLFSILAVVTGILYPMAITGIAQLVFPHQANGSLVERDGKVVGSELIGQSFFIATLFLESPVVNIAPT